MRMFINGEWVESQSGGTRDIVDPATLEVLQSVPESEEDDVRWAVDAAESAFQKWSEVPIRERGRMLSEAARRTKDQLIELSILLSKEQGKPLYEARGEILGYANVLEYYNSVSGSLQGSLVELPGLGQGMVTRHPMGVCAAIIPWNVPALTMAWKLAPCLLTGNTMVLKPAPSTPLTNLALTSILEASGIPPGVLNIVTGEGIPAGECLVEHAKVRKISFTGSTEVGRRVASSAGNNLKKVTLELGGSDPAIICSDVDLDKTASDIVSARFYNCGQACTSLKRIYVMNDIADALRSRIKDRILKLKMGRGIDESVQMGPIHSEKQRDYLKSQLSSLQDDRQGEIIVGGSIPDVGLPGYFFSPTLVENLAPDSRLLREEVFGPILPMVRVDSLDEALELSNSSMYGLGASIWSRDIDNIQKAVREFETGRVWVNMHLRVPVELPFGGLKASGLGEENGINAMQDYLYTKTVVLGR